LENWEVGESTLERPVFDEKEKPLGGALKGGYWGKPLTEGLQ